MNDGTQITVNDANLIESFRRLSVENMREVGKYAYGQSLPIIQQSAIGILSSEGINIDSIDPRSHKSMREGVTVKVYDDGTGGSVSALGEFKLKWFATGTDERWQNIKHGREKAGNAARYLGQIQRTDFLTKGYETSESMFETQLEDMIIESIERLLNE